MNERIQQLAEQARASVPPGLVVEEWIQVYNIKLGQLIVQECASIADQHTHEGDWDIAHMIRKHFGVEK